MSSGLRLILSPPVAGASAQSCQVSAHAGTGAAGLAGPGVRGGGGCLGLYTASTNSTVHTTDLGVLLKFIFDLPSWGFSLILHTGRCLFCFTWTTLRMKESRMFSRPGGVRRDQ